MPIKLKRIKPGLQRYFIYALENENPTSPPPSLGNPGIIIMFSQLIMRLRHYVLAGMSSGVFLKLLMIYNMPIEKGIWEDSENEMSWKEGILTVNYWLLKGRVCLTGEIGVTVRCCLRDEYQIIIDNLYAVCYIELQTRGRYRLFVSSWIVW